MRRRISAITILAALAITLAVSSGVEASTKTLYVTFSASGGASTAEASAAGTATITISEQTDYYGGVSATASFDVSLSGFPAGDQITQAHIHSGGSGTTGAIVVDTSVGTRNFNNGSATFQILNVNVDPSLASTIMDSPAGYYFDVHTTLSPNGSVRGQLSTQKPVSTTESDSTFTAILSPANEVPAVTGSEATGTGIGTLLLHVSKDSSGHIVGVTADFSFNVSNLPTEDKIILSHIHIGPAGTSGAIVIDSGLMPDNAISLTNGAASFSVTAIAVDPDTAQQVLDNPAGFYLNVHTNVNQGGAMRGQLVAEQIKTVTLGAALSPANEVPPVTGADATAKGQGNLVLHLTEDNNNNITGATADLGFNVTGLPAGEKIIFAHIHSGAAGSSGAIVIDSGLTADTPVSASGGVWSFNATGIAVSTDLAQQIMSNPSSFYLNVHSDVNQGGAARGQLESVPNIGSASIKGQKLILTGTNFVKGDVILLNGQRVKTKFSSGSQLVGKNVVNSIASGQTVTLQIQRADGLLSTTFNFTRN